MEYLYDPINDLYIPTKPPKERQPAAEAPAITSRDQLKDKHARKRFIDEHGEEAFFNLPATNPIRLE